MKLPKLSKLRDILYWKMGQRNLKPTEESIDFYFAWFQDILRRMTFQAHHCPCVCVNCKKLREIANPVPESWIGLVDKELPHTHSWVQVGKQTIQCAHCLEEIKYVAAIPK
jgi:hypothetical protein